MAEPTICCKNSRSVRAYHHHSSRVLHMLTTNRYKCKCDAEPVCARGQVNIQPTADNADNFTPWTRTLGHTCVNCMTVGSFCLHLLLRSTLLRIQRQSCPATLLTPSHWEEVGASSFFVMRKSQRAASSPYIYFCIVPFSPRAFPNIAVGFTTVL